MTTILKLATVIGAVALTTSALAAPVIHEDPASLFVTSRTAGSAPVGRLTVSSAQTISSFGLKVDLVQAGNLTFEIFNSTTGALLYASGPKFFVDDGMTYKFSDDFSFTFQTGITYGLTAFSDVAAGFSVDNTANTVGAFNFLTGNQNVNGKTLNLGQNCCDVWTALNVGEANRVPEPATLALTGLGLYVASRTRRRQVA